MGGWVLILGKKCSQAISIGLVQWQHICEVGWWWLCGLVAVPHTARHTCRTDMPTQKFKKLAIISPFRIDM